MGEPATQLGQLRILMVSDFFYPNFGGVENHIYQLSQCLINQGHKVVVMTHAYGDCGGVRYLTNGLKVYYLYRRPIHAQSTMPTWVGAFRMLRLICIREGINLVHCHQAFSTLGAEALVQARTMGYKVVFTDHSLFGFADASSIATNKLIKAVLADVQHVICVSHTSKENTVLRACLHPAAVSVIPNAVDASEFEPNPGRPRPVAGGPITVVALSRLVYRKGIDILALVIPEICHRHPNVIFIIGGDGPKRRLLEQMIVQEGLSSRVKLTGAIPHEKARDFLLQGHIFVNASLTEAFCMAIVEAASAGLLVVSTRVGGVPEVLPPDVMLLAEPSPEDLLDALEEALHRVPDLDPVLQHKRVQAMYNWPNVAERTAAVYNKVLSTASNHDELLPRLRRYRSIGMWAGLVFCCIAVLLHWFWRFLEWQQPAAEVERAVDWPSIQEMLATKPQQQQQQQQQHLHHQERQQNPKPEPDLQQHVQQGQQPAAPVERGVDWPSVRQQMLEDKQQQQRGEQRGEQDDSQGAGQQHTQQWQQIEQEQARQQQQQEEQGIMSGHRQRQRVSRYPGQPVDQDQRQQQEQQGAASVNVMVDGQKTAGRYNLRSRTKK